jgi:hypothetical protein
MNSPRLLKIYSKRLNKTKQNVLQTFHKIEMEETLLNTFYEVIITLTPKPDKFTIKQENYIPISLINICAKILNKILANQSQQTVKKIVHGGRSKMVTRG